MSIPFTIGGLQMRVMGQNALTQLAAASQNDRVLVILQMHGGNDGLNCLVPIESYDTYYSLRPNIAIPTPNNTRGYIPLDNTLPDNAKVGLHPDMQAMKSLYDQGRVAIVQGVSYQNNDGSHFRGRDIWLMGGSSEDYMQSGWIGRYLKGEYAPYEYPQQFPIKDGPDKMLDPLAIEVGGDVSLIFHQQGNIPASISLYSIPDFAELVGELEGFREDELLDPRGIPPAYLSGSPYFKELQWILDLEDKSKDYAERLAQVYSNATETSVTYPHLYPFNAPSGSLQNPLSYQLKMVSRLIAGGCKTKVFLVKIGGFDTHAEQVESYDPTMGHHAALMYHISTAMQAFQNDLKARGLEDLVLTVTTSEFGRRVKSNGSYGTDHGTGGPLFIFGKGVRPGLHGEAFDITPGNNVSMQYDYREVYASIMRDWMLVDNARLNDIFPDPSVPGKGIVNGGTSDGITMNDPLPLAQQVITGNEGFIGDRFALEDCFPNPAKDLTTIHFRINSAYHVNIELMDNQGKRMKTLVDAFYKPGEHKVEVELTGLPPGHYIYELKTGFYKEARKLVIVK